MARKAGSNGSLEQAMRDLVAAQANLIQAQAQLTQMHTAFVAETRDRFKKIDEDFEWIKAALLRHEHILEELPEAIREKIGFAPKQPGKGEQ